MVAPCRAATSSNLRQSKVRNSVASKLYHNLIGGEWRPSVAGQTFQNINPADHSDVVGIFPSSNSEDVALAVAAAKKAFVTWRLVPAPKRAEILYRAGALLSERQE